MQRGWKQFSQDDGHFCEERTKNVTSLLVSCNVHTYYVIFLCPKEIFLKIIASARLAIGILYGWPDEWLPLVSSVCWQVGC